MFEPDDISAPKGSRYDNGPGVPAAWAHDSPSGEGEAGCGLAKPYACPRCSLPIAADCRVCPKCGAEIGDG